MPNDLDLEIRVLTQRGHRQIREFSNRIDRLERRFQSGLSLTIHTRRATGRVTGFERFFNNSIRPSIERPINLTIATAGAHRAITNLQTHVGVLRTQINETLASLAVLQRSTGGGVGRFGSGRGRGGLSNFFFRGGDTEIERGGGASILSGLISGAATLFGIGGASSRFNRQFGGLAERFNRETRLRTSATNALYRARTRGTRELRDVSRRTPPPGLQNAVLPSLLGGAFAFGLPPSAGILGAGLIGGSILGASYLARGRLLFGPERRSSLGYTYLNPRTREQRISSGYYRAPRASGFNAELRSRINQGLATGRTRSLSDYYRPPFYGPNIGGGIDSSIFATRPTVQGFRAPVYPPGYNPNFVNLDRSYGRGYGTLPVINPPSPSDPHFRSAFAPGRGPRGGTTLSSSLFSTIFGASALGLVDPTFGLLGGGALAATALYRNRRAIGRGFRTRLDPFDDYIRDRQVRRQRVSEFRDARNLRGFLNPNRGIGGVSTGATSALTNLTRTIGRLTPAVTGLAGAFGLIGGAIASIRLTDQYTGLQNRLRLVTGGPDHRRDTQGQLFDLSRDVRAPYASTSQIFTRFALAGNRIPYFGNFGALRVNPNDPGGAPIPNYNALEFTRSVQQAAGLSGATPQEQRNALIQFSQGFQSGQFRGEEFRSVSEQLPFILRVLTRSDRAREAGINSLGSLRRFAYNADPRDPNAGITPDFVVDSFAQFRTELNVLFSQIVPRIGESFFGPTVSGFQELIGTFGEVTGFAESLARSFISLGESLSSWADIIRRDLPDALDELRAFQRDLSPSLLETIGDGLKYIADQVTRLGNASRNLPAPEDRSFGENLLAGARTLLSPDAVPLGASPILDTLRSVGGDVRGNYQTLRLYEQGGGELIARQNQRRPGIRDAQGRLTQIVDSRGRILSGAGGAPVRSATGVQLFNRRVVTHDPQEALFLQSQGISAEGPVALNTNAFFRTTAEAERFRRAQRNFDIARTHRFRLLGPDPEPGAQPPTDQDLEARARRRNNFLDFIRFATEGVRRQATVDGVRYGPSLFSYRDQFGVLRSDNPLLTGYNPQYNDISRDVALRSQFERNAGYGFNFPFNNIPGSATPTLVAGFPGSARHRREQYIYGGQYGAEGRGSSGIPIFSEGYGELTEEQLRVQQGFQNIADVLSGNVHSAIVGFIRDGESISDTLRNLFGDVLTDLGARGLTNVFRTGAGALFESVGGSAGGNFIGSLFANTGFEGILRNGRLGRDTNQLLVNISNGEDIRVRTAQQRAADNRVSLSGSGGGNTLIQLQFDDRPTQPYNTREFDNYVYQTVSRQTQYLSTIGA